MQKKFKILLALACFTPALVLAEKPTVVNVVPPVINAPIVAAKIDPVTRASIKELLDAINIDKLITVIGQTARIQAKQLVPAILSDALDENKTLSDVQKRSVIPTLQKDAIPKLVARAGESFETAAFRADALEAQYQAYSKYYTVDEIKGLTQFYRTPTGKKFIEVQDQVGHDIVNGVLQKHMPEVIKAIRAQADQEVASARPAAAAPAKAASSIKK